MTVNIGTVDRSIRVILGVALLALIFVGPKSLWGLIGIVPLATAMMGYCPAYSLLGIKTCQTRNNL